jgi:hypothetical protein
MLLLSDKQEVAMYDHSDELIWPNRVRWARQKLVDDGYLYSPKGHRRGYWKLTPEGIIKAANLHRP